ncbi:arylphorin subunit A4-like [Lucilia sericata]|uniref:arylphorin subunit A4-like n=1 Tax=Lucilia sericata TaxID=13632 RepID=UPI0018A85B12|nr:arylphorin subunit A4-like [Lucilia sericata]
MKIFIVLLAIVGLVTCSSVVDKKFRIADKEFLAKQKFLFEIVYRIEDPLMFEEWIKMGKSFVFDKSGYTHYGVYMEKFYEAYKYNALLPKGEFFGALVKTHLKQAYGLFEFFYYAKNWEVFQSNVAWARMHCNEGMFIYALTLAVIHRNDFQGLILPSIHEIFPQYFFNNKFIYAAEKFDYQVWSKYIMYEKEYKDILYKEYANHDNQYYFLTKNWKMWQWWKMMGLGEHWYSEDHFMLRENISEYYRDPKFLEICKSTNIFFMPVDYTRDIEFFNKESALSYFTEDVGLNAYWYYLNMDYAFFLDGKTYGLNKDRRGEYWLYNVRQILSRYYMERLSHGFGEIPEFSYFNIIEYGYKPQLVYHNGVGYSYRKNYYEVESYGKFDYYYKVMDFFNRLDEIITKGVYVTYEGKTIDLRKPESIEYIGSIMQGNVDAFDEYFFKYWYMFAHMYFGDVNTKDFEVLPHVFLNYETVMRDPLFYMFYKKIASVYYQFFYYVKPYTHEELLFPGVTIKDVKVSELVTYFDLVDFDVTNLLNDEITFVDGKFVWDKTLLARQMRLNHKPFDFEFTVESDKEQKVVIRSYLAPKYDEFGRVITLAENRENVMEIDSFIYTLKSGINKIMRMSRECYWTIEDRTTYTEMYKYVMLALDDKYQFPLYISEPHCGFPDRLILPRGWYKGMPMQLFFYISPFTADYEPYSTYDYTYSCGIGSGVRHIDERPFGYPFDREIDEYEFFVPNMYFKDVKIYHKEIFEKYFEHRYENFGHFDHEYFH